MTPANNEIKRHDPSDIRIHWFNAACWLVLLVSGLGLIKNDKLNPLGAWLPDVLRALFGGGSAGGAVLLVLHEVVGVVWLVGIVIYMGVNAGGTRFFLREIFSLRPGDFTWMVRKMLRMTVGGGGELPPQGYYNMGQKAFAQASVLGGIAIGATGMILLASDKILPASVVWLVGWAVTLHYLAVGLVFAGLLVHIYMAAISPEEKPGFRSMFTGTVPRDYARHHHGLWVDALDKGEPGAK
ncbi:MAG: cytochrome b/b6 domain-containing protein [Humidesulfovibrio sp.]|uniref:formate dehydrogenase subunit gamma n=1 Tax=Humidesulfovibrio sp. TaxID=2910988 RepID=UPI0027371711|nr:cytochrome b/b6 domain-containing protein [Humidesulfovibrio sp.]MDP2847308.1 cytochrome b/b6 domain-containing protein [Humidesulfovibrio sp.]